jgi:hypothetical protein
MTTASGFTAEGTHNPDSLFAGNFPVATRKVTIAAGANLGRGAVLGRVTATDKWKLSASAAGDGSEVPDAVLLTDAAAAGADVEAMIAQTGEFNEAKLVLGVGHTIASIRAGLRGLAIFIKKVVAA